MAYTTEQISKYHKEVWYPKNKEKRLLLGRQYKQRNIQRFQDWKKLQECKICREKETVCLDLHHLDPEAKDFTVSTKVCSTSWEKLLIEINKCVVLCANCHRKVHAGIVQLEE
jgi:hypothetical protein